MATLGSVGIGSGVLTSDILEQLKENERTTQINPVERSIEANTGKTEALDLLKSLASTLQTSASSMKDDSLYLKRTVSGATDDIEVTASDGVGIQDFSISDVKLAQKNVIQSGSFTSGESKIATGTGTLNLHIDGTDYKINYTSDTSYDDLKAKINDVAGDKVTASTLQTGDDSYSFMIISDETGKDQQIGLVDLDGNLNDELKMDSFKSLDYDEKTSTIALSGNAGSLSVNVGTESFDFDFDDTTTLQQLADMINEHTDTKDSVYASIIKNDNDGYNIVLTAKGSATDKEISITENEKVNAKLISAPVTDVLDSGEFNSATDTIAASGTSGSFDVGITGNFYSFDYDDTTTLEELKDMINNDPEASQKVQASIVEENGKFKLRLKNQDTEDPMLYTRDSYAINELDSAAYESGGASSIQEAKDSSFKYNGINMTRSSNTVDDIKLGLEIKLLKEDASANISITQDAEPIKEELKTFVEAFNTMQKQIDTMTLADMDAEKVGVFNGNSSISGIGRNLRDLLTSRDGSGLALSNFGLEIDRTGKLSFDSSAFDKKMKEDSQAITNYFSGETTVIEDFDSKKDAFTRFAESKGITYAKLEKNINDEKYTLTDKLFENEDYTFNDIEDFTKSEISIYNYKMDSTTHTDGIFEKLYDNVKGLNNLGGTILSISNGLSTEGKQLEENKEKSLTALNSRYDTMTARFIQYDSMINKMNNQFAALQQQIAMAVNG